MNIHISRLAIAKLAYLLYEDKGDQPLAVHVIPLISGCSTPSFALELTEIPSHEKIKRIEGIPFVWESWMEGLQIDLNRESGKFSIYHPDPPFRSDCTVIDKE